MGPRRSPTGRSPGLNEGLPQKGKQYDAHHAATLPHIASMKGFPRRGSNGEGGTRQKTYYGPQ